MPFALGVAHFAEGFGFDLTNAFARDFEVLADFLEGPFATIDEAVALLEDLALPLGEGLEDGADLFLEHGDRGLLAGIGGALILDEVADEGVAVFAGGGVNGDGFLGHFEEGADALDGEVQLGGEIFGRGLAAEILGQLPLDANEAGEHVDHVGGDADGAGLIGDAPADGLANPPRGAGGKFAAAAVFKFLDRAHQADVAFLDEIEEWLAAMLVFAGNGDDEAKIGFDHFRAGVDGLALPFFEFLMADEEFLGAEPEAGLLVEQHGLEAGIGGGLAAETVGDETMGFVGQFHPLFDDAHLESELRVDGEELAAAGGEGLGEVFGGGMAAVGERLAPGLVAVENGVLEALREPGQGGEIFVALGDFAGREDVLCAFLAGHELVGELQVRPGDRAEEIHLLAHLVLGGLDATADLGLLLAGENAVAGLAEVNPQMILGGIGRRWASFVFIPPGRGRWAVVVLVDLIDDRMTGAL